MSGKSGIVGASTISYQTSNLLENNSRPAVNSQAASTNPRVKTSGTTAVKNGDSSYKIDWRALYNAAFSSGLTASEAKKFADAHATGAIHWTLGDPTDDRKNGITGSDLRLVVGAKYEQNLSGSQVADLTARVNDYTARGGKLFSRKETPPLAAPQTNPNEQIAARNNYDTSAQLRNRLENQLPPQPVPQPAPTPIMTARVKPVSEMSSDEKIGESLTRMVSMLPDSMREKVEAMLTPAALTALTVVLGARAVGHYIGVSEVIDALAIIGLVAAGVEVLDLGEKLYAGASLAINAQTEDDLNRAAKNFADALGGGAVDIAAAVITKKAGGAMERGINNLPKLPPPPPMLATPNGILVPAIARPSVLETNLPIWATTTTAPIFGSQIDSSNKGSNVLESRANETLPSGTKPVNLPAWEKLTVDIEHITSGHKAGGSRLVSSEKAGKGKNVFPEWMTDKQILSAVKEAYGNAKKIKTQNIDGETIVKLVGESQGMKIEMYVNLTQKKLTTIYPLFGIGK